MKRVARTTLGPNPVPASAIDEQTALEVVDGAVEVVSEGRWTKFGS